MSLDPALRARIDALLSAHRAVLFMKGVPEAPQCGFSARTVAALSALGTPYAHVDVLADPAIREGIKAYGDWPTIPQLYVDGQLVGGCDIVVQMARSGELHALLGVPAPDRTPPSIRVSQAALAVLRDALANAGDGYAVGVELDAARRARLQLVPLDDDAVRVDIDGVPVQFDPMQLRLADGLDIDWVDDHRGRGLVATHPHAPPPVVELDPAAAATRVRAGTLRLFDVRPAEERALAPAPVAVDTFDAGTASLESLPRETPVAFLCHHGRRSHQAAEHARGLGFTSVHNVAGGIDAWADIDASIPRY